MEFDRITTTSRFLSDYRFPVCSIYEDKTCDVESNDTRSMVRNSKLNSEMRQSTTGAAKNIVEYGPAAFLK